MARMMNREMRLKVCSCLDCGSHTKAQGRAHETRQWRAEAETELLRIGFGDRDPDWSRCHACGCPCHAGPDHCPICSNDYADFCDVKP